MAKTSKIRAKGNGYTNGIPDKPSVFICTRCGKEHSRQRGYFPSSRSELYKGNDGYVPICNMCIEELFEYYRSRFPAERDAMRRLCMVCDIYWCPSLYEAIIENGSPRLSLIRSYISRLNGPKFRGKTFDDTVDEERLAQENVVIPDRPEPKKTETDKKQTSGHMKVPSPSAETILFWGSGLSPEMYQDLNLRYQRWTRRLQKPLEDGVEGLYKQLCLAEANVVQNIAAGKNIEAGQKVINDIMSKLGITPDQQAEEDDALGIDTTPMGVWIRRWEDKRPLPEEDDDMKDSAGVIRYINTWFLGHIGKMLGIKNIYTKMYEDEISKWRIDRPEFADEDDDDFIIDLFGENDGDDQ